MMGAMLLLLFLLSLSYAGTFAGLIFGNLGDRCGRDNLGHVTLIDDCPTGIIDHFDRANGKVCCVKENYPEKKKSLGKSEEACNNFGPGFRRKVFPSRYVLPGEYQHNVALGYEKGPKNDEIVWGQCNGVLISEYYVLTTAHCMTRVDAKTPVMIRLGNIDLSGEEDPIKPQDISVAQIIIHPDFNYTRKVNDIALMQLEEAAKFNEYVQPACLYVKTDTPDGMVATGWGKPEISDGAVADILLKSNVRSVDTKICNEIYARGRKIIGSQLCGLTDTGICHLGAGSPLFIENGEDSRVTLVGLASFGRGCSSSNPDIYSRVSSYLNWIEEIVWP